MAAKPPIFASVMKTYKSALKRGTHLAYFKHIIAAGNLNYGITEICCINLCRASYFFQA